MACEREIMRGLEVHPELGRIAEVVREQKGGFRRDAALASDQFVDAVERDVQGPGKLGLSQPQWFEELRKQELTGMSSDPQFWQHDVDSSVVQVLVIISTANLFTSPVGKLEYDSILLVHADTVKAGQISFQFLQPVGGRCPQILDRRASVQQIEFLLHPAPKFASNSTGRFAVAPVIDVGGRRISEAGDHKGSIPEYPLSMYSPKLEA
jgi:hypothetical protein